MIVEIHFLSGGGGGFPILGNTRDCSCAKIVSGFYEKKGELHQYSGSSSYQKAGGQRETI